MELPERYQLFYRLSDLDNVVNDELYFNCTGLGQNNFPINPARRIMKNTHLPPHGKSFSTAWRAGAGLFEPFVFCATGLDCSSPAQSPSGKGHFSCSVPQLV